MSHHLDSLTAKEDGRVDITVASDILRTAVAPTRQDILNLGAIVFLQTLLNYFLEREIRQGEQSRFPEAVISSKL
jgi:uncharacterized membrane protein